MATGDGMALALRAGAVLRDLEFVQFHPTVMWLGAGSTGQQPLVSEAVRGEGAFLVDDDGVRFMRGQHELADLAPRDVVAKAIMRRMRESGRPHMWLDARQFGAAKWENRFPTILATCRAHAIDPVTSLIPVAPACHYASGGVATDLSGQSSVPGLFACGEVACSGVHGANRLASNSLLEGLVFSRRIASRLRGGLPPRQEPVDDPRPTGLVAGGVRASLQDVMTERAGVLRSHEGLGVGAKELAALTAREELEPGVDAWETTNLLTVAAALVGSAQRREETRGRTGGRTSRYEMTPGWSRHIDVGARKRHPLLPREAHSRRSHRVISCTPYAALPTDLLDRLASADLDPRHVHDAVIRALEEDQPGEDVTSAATIGPDAVSTADLVARAGGVVAGLDVAELVFRTVTSSGLDIDRSAGDGRRVERGDVLITVVGPTASLAHG